MQKSPLFWSVREVGEWLDSHGWNNANATFATHAVNGKDLLALTDDDLKSDLQFKFLHDRKYLLRAIEALNKTITVHTEVVYGQDICRVRLPDHTTYTFEALKYDCAKYFGVLESSVVLKDDKGFVWGVGPVSIILDSNLCQTEAIYLELAQPPTPRTDRYPTLRNNLSTDEDEEDFNEDNPYHICKAVRSKVDLSDFPSQPPTNLPTPSVRTRFDFPHRMLKRSNSFSNFSAIQEKLENLESELESFKQRTALATIEVEKLNFTPELTNRSEEESMQQMDFLNSDSRIRVVHQTLPPQSIDSMFFNWVNPSETILIKTRSVPIYERLHIPDLDLSVTSSEDEGMVWDEEEIPSASSYVLTIPTRFNKLTEVSQSDDSTVLCVICNNPVGAGCIDMHSRTCQAAETSRTGIEKLKQAINVELASRPTPAMNKLKRFMDRWNSQEAASTSEVMEVMTKAYQSDEKTVAVLAERVAHILDLKDQHKSQSQHTESSFVSSAGVEDAAVELADSSSLCIIVGKNVGGFQRTGRLSELLQHPKTFWSSIQSHKKKIDAWAPGPVHLGIAKIVSGFAKLSREVTVVTTEIDGLQRRILSPDAALYELHGSLQSMRCSKSWTKEFYRTSLENVPQWAQCEAIWRPVLQMLDENRVSQSFHVQGARNAAKRSSTLLLLGQMENVCEVLVADAVRESRTIIELPGPGGKARWGKAIPGIISENLAEIESWLGDILYNDSIC